MASLFESMGIADEPIAQKPEEKKRDRTWGEAADDTLRAAASGVGGIVKSAGDLGGLVTGNMDNSVSELGRSTQEYWEGGQSTQLKDKKAERQKAIDSADGIGWKAWEAFKGTVTDPTLAIDAVASNIATMLPGAVAGRVAAGASAASKMTAASGFGPVSAAAREAIGKAAGTIGTRTAIGVGALQQGSDVAGDVYQSSMKKSNEAWAENPDFMAALSRELDSNPNIESAVANTKHIFALQAARESLPGSAAISVASNAIPGGDILERTLVGGAAKNTLKSSGALAVAKGIAKGAAGESAQEAIEEGGGAFVGNVAKQRNVDPNQDLSEDVGANAGIGAGGALFSGGAAGAFHQQDHSPVIEKAAEPGSVLSRAAVAGSPEVRAQIAAPAAFQADDLFNAATDLAKYATSPEVSATLPGEERSQVLQLVQTARNKMVPVAQREAALEQARSLIASYQAGSQHTAEVTDAPRAPGAALFTGAPLPAAGPAPLTQTPEIPVSTTPAGVAANDAATARMQALAEEDGQQGTPEKYRTAAEEQAAQAAQAAATVANQARLQALQQEEQGATPSTTPSNPAVATPSNTAPTPSTTPSEPAKPRLQVIAPKVTAPAGNGPAETRMRKAQLDTLVKEGFDAVESRPDGHWLVNHKTNQESPLQNMGDMQRARKAIADHIHGAVHESPNSPLNEKRESTPAQQEAGNYQKPVLHRLGMKVRVENPVHSTRRGVGPDGKAWSSTMANTYGEIEGTRGADGDPVDAFIGHGDRLFVVDQLNQDGSFDEHKVMLGFRNEAEARAAYLANYEKGWTGLGAITEMSPQQFKAWSKSSSARNPVSTTIAPKHNGGEYGANIRAAGPGVAESAGVGGEVQAEVVRGDGNAPVGSTDNDQPILPSGAATNRSAATDGSAWHLAKSSPVSVLKNVQADLLRSRNVIAVPHRGDMSWKHAIASVIANMLGKTYTVMDYESGLQTDRPNGFVNALEGRHIFIDNESNEAPLMVVMHEAYHGLPGHIRHNLNLGLYKLFKREMREEFAREFDYDINNAGRINEEIPAFMAQAISRRADFWEQLRDVMGNGDFMEVAQHILRKLNEILIGVDDAYGTGFIEKYITDVEQARDLLVDAYAQAMRESGVTTTDPIVVASIMSSNAARKKAEPLGDFMATTAKDGSLIVFGNADDIRSQLPDGLKGRASKEGVAFTTHDAPRVRSALSGDSMSYSRNGEVLNKLPTRNGKYVGAPERFDTPGKIPHLRKWMMKLAKEGEDGRFWYEQSSRAILRMAGGNVEEAKKFAALLAIYSPQAKVDTNSTFALRAWAQYKAGQPISVKTGVMDSKAQAALDDTEGFWSGEKTGNFHQNLLREIDPSTKGTQGATVDMWMMRAALYQTDAPTKTQYAFMENENNRLAAELGWEPQQVQAAIWVAMKARMENPSVTKATVAKSLKKGWMKQVTKDTKDQETGKIKTTASNVIADADKHRENWYEHAIAHDPSAADTKRSKFDFEDGLQRHIGQISFEARPSTSVDILPGIHQASYAQQIEFQQAIQAAFLDNEGGDMLAKKLGLLVDNNDIITPGVWEGVVSPSQQKLVAMAPGKYSAKDVDPAQAKALNAYAAITGLLTRQDGVGWHRPFYNVARKSSNGLEVDLGRPITQDETQALEKSIGEWMKNNGRSTFTDYKGDVVPWNAGFAIISTPTGVRLVTFGVVSNEELQSQMLDVAGTVLPESSAVWFVSSGDMPTNDWKVNQNGQNYITRASAEGSSDVLGWARAVLAPRLQHVYDDFSKRYGWGDPGRIHFSSRSTSDRTDSVQGRERDARRGDRGRQVADGALRNSASQSVALPGAPNVPGFHGPDPRLVSVAEKYAAENGFELKRQSEYVALNPERGQRIADAYEAMPHAPNDPQVKAAYANLIRQTIDQYEALTLAGYKFWFMDMGRKDNQDYASTPWNAMRDIRATQSMGVFPTTDGFGSSDKVSDNPLETTVTPFSWPVGDLNGPLKPVLANDLFRAVHDAFGHGLEGAGFRAEGEENAWQAHRRLFTGTAVHAITTETRGQNSWLNFGPHGDANRTAKVEDTHFADQKIGLLPEWVWTEGVLGDYDATMYSNRGQDDMFAGDLIDKDATTTREVVTGSRSTEQQTVGNEDSEGHRITGTSQGLRAFWDWFGDSEAVDDKGQPLVMYHSTNADLSTLKPNQKTTNNYGLLGDVDLSRAGIFMTPEKDFSQEYLKSGDGKNVIPLYVRLEHPFDSRNGISETQERELIDAGISSRWLYDYRQHDWEMYDNADDGSNAFVDALKDLGYDGAIFHEEGQDGKTHTTYMAFESHQVKSALGNRGTFDAAEPNILMSNRATGTQEMLDRVKTSAMKQAPAGAWKKFLKAIPGYSQESLDMVSAFLNLQTGKIQKEDVQDQLQAMADAQAQVKDTPLFSVKDEAELEQAQDEQTAEPQGPQPRKYEGLTVTVPVKIEDTGEVASLTMGVNSTADDYDARSATLQQLFECL